MTNFQLEYFPEGHLAWLEEILSELVTNDSEKCEYIKKVYSKYKAKENSALQAYGVTNYDDLNSYNNQHPSYVGLFARQLNEAAKDVYIGRGEVALDILEQLKSATVNLTGEHERLKQVMEYLINSLEFCCHWTKSKELENRQKSESSIRLAHLKVTWLNLQGNRTNKAVLLCMQGSLYRDVLNIHDHSSIYSQMLKQVIHLDPDYWVWYHYCYQSLRNERRVQFRNILPSPDEISMCETAYDLTSQPKNQMVLYIFALLLKDVLEEPEQFLANNGIVLMGQHFQNRDEVFQKCLQLFGDALKLAKEHKLTKWILRISVQSAELLLKYNTSDEYPDKGLKILLDLLKEYPNNAFLHNKLGQAYRFGTPSNWEWNKKHKSIDLAMHHFAKGLRLKQYNYFDCIKCYMYAFPYAPFPPITEAVELLEESLILANNIGSAQEQAQILIWKGCVVWMSARNLPRNLSTNQLTAAKYWINCLELQPDMWNLLFNIIRKQPYLVTGHELKTALNILQNESSDQQRRLIDRMLQVLPETNQRIPFQSLADQDTNWRVRK